MRQTDLTTEQLISALNAPRRPFPRCFYVNELGEMARQGDAAAEAAVRAFLDPEYGDAERASAYVHLMSLKHAMAAATKSALHEFADQTANEAILEWAKREHDILPPES